MESLRAKYQFVKQYSFIDISFNLPVVLFLFFRGRVQNWKFELISWLSLFSILSHDALCFMLSGELSFSAVLGIIGEFLLLPALDIGDKHIAESFDVYFKNR